MEPASKAVNQLSQNNKANTLYKVFSDFYQVHGTSPSNTEQFCELMINCFNKGSAHHFKTLCMNMNDGIGDFASQAYFAAKFDQIFGELANVNLQHITLISDEKLESSRFLLKDAFRDGDVSVLGEKTLSFDNSKKYLVGIPSDSQKITLNKILGDADLLLNLAIQLLTKESKLIVGFPEWKIRPCDFSIDTDNLKKSICLESWLQYDFLDLYMAYRSKSYKGPEFSQKMMGISENSTGIRFIDNIVEMSKQSEWQILDRISDKLKCSLGLTENRTHEQYLEDNAFAVGYMQDRKASIAFLKLSCLTSEKEANVNILVKQDFIESIDDESKNRLRDAGFKELIFPGKNVTLKLADNGTRVIRVLDFHGISDPDKLCFYGLSETISSSGDNSFSELVSATISSKSNVIPFVCPYLTGGNPSQTLLNDPSFQGSDLKVYFSTLNTIFKRESGKKVFNEVSLCSEEIALIKKNRHQIAKEWNSYCHHLFLNRNNEKFFNELIVTYTVNHMFKNNMMEEVLSFSNMVNDDFCNNNRLLYLAVNTRNLKAARFLLSSTACNINKVYGRFSVLELATLKGDTEMAELLINHGARFPIPAFIGLDDDLFSDARRSGFDETYNRLINYKFKLFIQQSSLPDDYKRSPILYDDGELTRCVVPYKNHKYTSVGDYLYKKRNPDIQSLDYRARFGNPNKYCIHGTNFSAVISAVLYSNKQLIPAIKQRKVTGKTFAHGESRGVCDLNSGHISNKYVSVIRSDRQSYAMIPIAIGYSLSAKSNITGTASNIPVLIVGDGSGEPIEVKGDKVSHSAYKRVNIRILVAHTNEDKFNMLAVLRELEVYDIKVCTLADLRSVYTLPNSDTCPNSELESRAISANKDNIPQFYQSRANKQVSMNAEVITQHTCQSADNVLKQKSAQHSTESTQGKKATSSTEIMLSNLTSNKNTLEVQHSVGSALLSLNSSSEEALAEQHRAGDSVLLSLNSSNEQTLEEQHIAGTTALSDDKSSDKESMNYVESKCNFELPRTIFR